MITEMIQLRNVSKVYTSAGGDVQAIRNTDLSIRKGENVVVIGKSGSGKSTLLNIISGIDRPSSGNVTVNGQNLNELNENKLALWRGENVGIVFQFYQLLPTLSVRDNVLFAMNLVNKIPPNQQRAKADLHLEEVGLTDKAKQFPNELSGGERQRVAIARAMANSPTLILADEPTGNLDSNTGEQINALFVRLNEGGTTLITVTHANITDRHFDKIIHIQDGQLSDQSKTQNTVVP